MNARAVLLQAAILASARALAGAQSLSLLPAADLRCEHGLVNPLGVDVLPPLLSWVPIAAASERGVAQAAYELNVTSNTGALVWSSGVVYSNSSSVRPAPGSIAYDSAYTWQVTWWGCTVIAATGACNGSAVAAPVSAVASFTTGLSAATWQQAAWLSCQHVGACDYLRSPVITLAPGPVVRATLHLATGGWTDVWLNGVRLGAAPSAALAGAGVALEGSWTQWNVRMPTTAYDVTALVAQAQAAGGNVSYGFLLLNGWWGHLGHRATASSVLSVQGPSGQPALYYTDAATWKGSAGPVKGDDIYNGETYDARGELPGWSTPAFDLSSWDTTSPVPDALLVNTTRSWQAVQPVVARQAADQVIPAVNVTAPSTSQYVVNFGVNSAGWTRLVLPPGCPAGTAISLLHAENLFPDGTVDQGNLRSARSTDTYTCDGRAQAVVYEPRGTYHGFDVVGVLGWPTAALGPPTTANFFKVEAHNAVEWEAFAAAGDPPASSLIFNNNNSSSNGNVLQLVNEMIRRGQLSNLVGGIATDCPQRDERQGWMADLSVSAESAINSWDMQAFYRQLLRTMVDSQASAAVMGDCDTSSPIYPDCNGADTDTSPHVPGLFGYRPADPSWGAALDIVYDLLLRYYADWDAAASFYPAVTAYADFLLRVAAAQGGLVTFHWYGDWLEPNQVASSEIVSQQTSAFNFLRTLRAAVNAATVLGNTGDAARYAANYTAAAALYNAKWFNMSGSGCYGTGRQAEQVFPLYLSLQPGGDAALESFVDSCLLPAIAANNTHVDTGIIATKYLPNLLSRVGRSDVALGMALQTDFPSWAAMALQFGATTITEHWNPINNPSGNGMSSRNHPAFGSIGSWFYTALLGVRLGDAASAAFSAPGLPPDVPYDGPVADGYGFTRVLIAPEYVAHPQLTSMAGGVHTVAGWVGASWSFSPAPGPNGSLALNASVPVGSRGEVRTPPGQWSPASVTVTEVGACAGAVVWQSGVFVPGACSGVVGGSVCGRSNDRVCLQVQSGIYAFLIQ